MTSESLRDGIAVDEMLDALHGRVETPLYTVVLYDSERYETVYLSDALRALYPDEDAMYDHFDSIHSYLTVDFAERELFAEQFYPDGGTMRYFTTALEEVKLLRVYDGQRGVCLAVDADEEVGPLVDAVETHLS